jgi:hypothetical protein
MKTVWKYPLEPDAQVEMPKGAMILDVQTQAGTPTLWALVDPKAAKEIRRFRTYGTGHDVPDNPGKFIGTVQIDWLVFHVFEVV